MRQPIGRKDSVQSVIRTSRKFDSVLYEAGQNFESFQIFKGLLKNQKYIAVDVLFKAYPKYQWSYSHADPIWPDGTFKAYNPAFSYKLGENAATVNCSTVQVYNPWHGFFLLPGHLGGFIERCS